ncbi:MAG: head-tail connector protein, partial [Bacteroidetes bacterium]|nr:head-tail connector protein [Bacteroidota bacterium]
MGDASEYNKRLKYLESQYGDGWKTKHQEITDFILPSRGYYQQTPASQGRETSSQIIDPEATRAVMIFAAGMMGGMTNPSRPWIRVRMQDQDLSKYGPVKAWLDRVEKILYFAYSQSNFYQCIYTDYIELIGFCTSCLLQEAGKNTLLNFSNKTAGTYYIQANSEGLVDTTYVITPMIAKNMIERFGDRCRQDIRTAAEKNPYQFFNVCHAVQPNDERKIGLIDGVNKMFQSVYFEPGQNDNILLKSGFEENPYHVSRYDTAASDVYGTGASFENLPNVKQLQEMQATEYIVIHKNAEPPVLVPSGMINDFDDLPGGITPWDGSTAKPERVYTVDSDISKMELKIEKLQTKITEGFFNDIFRMATSRPGVQPVNTAQIAQENEEKLILLGPLINRTIYEKLDPIVSRSLGILFRGGFLPPAPPEIQGQQLDTEYISLLAQAQKRIGSASLREFGAYVIELAMVKQ